MTRNLKLKASTKNAARSSGDSKSSSSPRVKTVGEGIDEFGNRFMKFSV